MLGHKYGFQINVYFLALCFLLGFLGWTAGLFLLYDFFGWPACWISAFVSIMVGLVILRPKPQKKVPDACPREHEVKP